MIDLRQGNSIITVWRKNWVYKFDGKLGTLEDTNNKYMYFMTRNEADQCNASNIYIDYLINIITNL